VHYRHGYKFFLQFKLSIDVPSVQERRVRKRKIPMKKVSGCIYIFHTEKKTYFKTKIPKETTSFSLTWMYVTGAPIFVLEKKILSAKYIWTETGVQDPGRLLFGSPDPLLFIRLRILLFLKAFIVCKIKMYQMLLLKGITFNPQMKVDFYSIVTP
jgi:hypothetical protein